MLRLLKVCLSILSLAGSQVSAQTTPDHVYQTVQGPLNVLEMINEANFSTSKPANTSVEPALPRHVLQLARDVWRKTQLLRFMNGLPTSALEPVPSRQIKPADVKLTVDQIFEQLVGVLPAYGIEDIPELPALTSGKKPTDVFQSLLKLSASLDGLGIPSTVPNDVHQCPSSEILAPKAA